MPLRRHPHLYELNARITVEKHSAALGRRTSIGELPEAEWRRLAERGIDLVWPMGIWMRSDASRRIAREHPGLRGEYDRALPGWSDADVGGSPYAVARYAIDPSIGDQDDPVRLRRALERCGLGLILDFVPNHLAVDHPWVLSHPERLVAGTPQAVREHPDRFFPPRPGLNLAHGRDPWSAPWTDTVQINHFAPGAREALGNELLRIAALVDGVRCDMAMLVLDDAFRSTWSGVVEAGGRAAWPDFWPEAIARVRRSFPAFLFIAEAYRDLDPLLAMGFDFVYDKGLYDRLLHGDAGAVREHLAGHPSGRFLRFIENHDEARAAEAFGAARSRAAAIVTGASPGCRLFHDGQAEGRRIRLPVQLIREPDEPADREAALFYDRLFRIVDAPVFHAGAYRLLDVAPAGDPGDSHRNLLAWSWEDGDELRIVVVNYSGTQSSGRLRFPLPPSGGGAADLDAVILDDLLHDVSYRRNRREIADPGLYVDLRPWEAHLLRPQ